MVDLSLIPILRAVSGGALLGVAASLALVGHGRITGISGIISRLRETDGRTFRVAFLAGVVGVALLAAVIAPTSIGQSTTGVPTLAIAGLLVGVGTTYGNGCTVGHGICGVSRGSRRSFVGVCTFMVAA